MKALFFITFLLSLSFSNTALGEEHLTLEQLPSAIEEYNERKEAEAWKIRDIDRAHIEIRKKINSFEHYQQYYRDIEGALSFEEYQTLYGLTKEEFVKRVFGNIEHSTPDQLAKIIELYNRSAIGTRSMNKRITSLRSYREEYANFYGFLAPEMYEILYGISEEDFVRQVFRNIKHLTLQELPNAIEQYNKSDLSKYHGAITSFKHYQENHRYIYRALTPETYQMLHGISEEEFVRQVFGNMEHLSLDQLPKAIEEYNNNERVVASLESYENFYSHIDGALSLETYQTLHGISEEEFVRQVFGNMEHLSLDQLPKAIEEYNNNARRESNRKRVVASLESYENFYSHIDGALSLETYQTLHGISKEEFVRQVFGNMEHFSLDQLPAVIDQHNDTVQSASKRITSFENFQEIFSLYDQTLSQRIHPHQNIYDIIAFMPNLMSGVFSFETYQTLYEISDEDFARIVFKNTAHLKPHQLGSAIKEYNENADKSEKITSITSYIRHHRKIKGALHSELYIFLYFRKPGEYQKSEYQDEYEYQKSKYQKSVRDFIETVINITTLSLEQLPNAIEEHNRIADTSKKITSLESYENFYSHIDGALSLETYQTLHGISEEFIIKLIIKADKRLIPALPPTKPTRKTTRTKDKSNKIENLTLEQLSSAIEKHNERIRERRGKGYITSFERYQKHHHYIPGALSFEEYQTSHEITEEEFVRQVFGNIEHLTPNQLSTAIREHNNQGKTKITAFSVYQMHYTQIPGALPFETYETLYGVTKEDFVKLIKNRCETEFTRI